MNGYHGQFLKVDLTKGTTSTMPLAKEDMKNFIGGATLSAKLMYDHINADMDPLAPESPLVFATGPFTGTTIPMVSRYSICGISPLTGYWGEATSGGKFPFRLKATGYDGIFITGKADKPVYLYLSDETVEIKDAAFAWGKDSYDTQELIKENENQSKLSVACIGSAGENLLRTACVMNDKGRAAGRCGLGALMGSKNLKAVVVDGKSKSEIHDKETLKKLNKEAHWALKNDVGVVGLGEYGTMLSMDMGMLLGDVPAKYFTKAVLRRKSAPRHCARPTLSAITPARDALWDAVKR